MARSTATRQAKKKSKSNAAKAASSPRKTTARKKAIKRPKRATKQPAPEDIDDDVLEFIAALDDYKLQHDRPFPSWSEVLHVLKSLGYRRC